MHPYLVNISFFNLFVVFDSEEKCISFFTDLGMIPRRNGDVPLCPRCGFIMGVRNKPKTHFKWLWMCKANVDGKRCYAMVNPTQNTIFAGMQLSCQDIIGLIYCFVLKLRFCTVVSELSRFRRYQGKSSISSSTVSKFFTFLSETCEIQDSIKDIPERFEKFLIDLRTAYPGPFGLGCIPDVKPNEITTMSIEEPLDNLSGQNVVVNEEEVQDSIINESASM